jgi:hypothetical protein
MEMDLEDSKRLLLNALQNYPDLAERAHRIQNFRLRGNILEFDLERHPCLEDIKTKGMPSPGYFLLRQIYSFDSETGVIVLEDEEYLDIVIEYLAPLVEEDVGITINGILKELETATNEEEVIRWAEDQCQKITEIIRETKYPPYEMTESLVPLWNDYLERYAAEWKKQFMSGIIKNWKSQRSP